MGNTQLPSITAHNSTAVAGTGSRATDSRHRIYNVAVPRVVAELHTKTGCAWGVAYLDDKFFVVCESSRIQAYDGLNYKRLKKEDIKVPKKAVDIVACTATKSLYIAGHCASLWRVSLYRRPTVSRFPPNRSTNLPLSAQSLSIRAGRLLVTTCGAVNLLLFRCDDGVELNRLSLVGFGRLYHAVETLSETFIVCHCHYQPHPQSAVCEVDSSGRVIRQWDGQLRLEWPDWFLTPRWKPEYLNIQHLWIDSRGQVFVANSINYCILLLSANLTFERILIHSRRLAQCSRRLCYIEDSDRLAVTLWSGAAKVFNMH